MVRGPDLRSTGRGFKSCIDNEHQFETAMPQKLVSGDSRFVCTGIANARVFWRHLHHFCLDLEFNELIYVGLDGCDECPKSKNYFRFGAPLGGC